MGDGRCIVCGVAAVVLAALALSGATDVERRDEPRVEVLGAVELPTTVVTSTSVTTTSEPPVTAPQLDYQEVIGAEAMAGLDGGWRRHLAHWEIDFLPGREGIRGLTIPAADRIEVYVRADDTSAFVERVLAHEIGHALDLELNDARDRGRWRTARGAGAGVLWWPDGTTFDFDTLAGDFAEAYAVYRTGAGSRSRVSGPYTADQLELLVELVS